jgi:hypothetical protein
MGQVEVTDNVGLRAQESSRFTIYSGMQPILLVMALEINGCSSVPAKRQAETMLCPVSPVQ